MLLKKNRLPPSYPASRLFFPTSRFAPYARPASLSWTRAASAALRPPPPVRSAKPRQGPVASLPLHLDPFFLRPPRNRLRPAKSALDLFLPVTPRWARFAHPTPPGGLQPPPAPSSPTVRSAKPRQGPVASLPLHLDSVLLRPPRHHRLPGTGGGFRTAFGGQRHFFRQEGRFARGASMNHPSFRKKIPGGGRVRHTLGNPAETAWMSGYDH